MLRSQVLALAIMAGAAALPMAGCDRPDATSPGSVDIRSETGIGAVRLAQQSADDANEKSSAPDQAGDLMDDSADTGDKSADTIANAGPDTSADVVASVPGDAAISAKVTSALAADASLKSADIKVDAKDGRVTLSGNVDSANLRLHAKEVAARQRGVVDVIDKMTTASHG